MSQKGLLTPIKLEPEQALQVILKGMETGQIRLPFSKTIKADEMEALVKNNCAKGIRDKNVDAYSIAYELARSARMDSLYILTMFATLTNGLDEEETDHLNSTFKRIFDYL